MQADNTFDDQIGRDLSVRGARVSPIRSPAWHGSSTWPDQLTSAVRVEAINLVDNVHSREDGVVGGGEQLLCRPGLARCATRRARASRMTTSTSRSPARRAWSMMASSSASSLSDVAASNARVSRAPFGRCGGILEVAAGIVVTGKGLVRSAVSRSAWPARLLAVALTGYEVGLNRKVWANRSGSTLPAAAAAGSGPATEGSRQ